MMWWRRRRSNHEITAQVTVRVNGEWVSPVSGSFTLTPGIGITNTSPIKFFTDTLAIDQIALIKPNGDRLTGTVTVPDCNLLGGGLLSLVFAPGAIQMVLT